MHKFQREGWTCDDCKCCLICGESQTNVIITFNQLKAVVTLSYFQWFFILFSPLFCHSFFGKTRLKLVKKNLKIVLLQNNYKFCLFFQEDLIICEYCDRGVHYTCLSPPPDVRPKVWDCDDCLIARGKPPNNNIKKRSRYDNSIIPCY